MSGDEIKKILYGKYYSEPSDDIQLKNPMEQIENDIRDLMKRCQSLSNEYNEHKRETRSDTKNMLMSFIRIADDIEDIITNIDSETSEANRQTKNLILNFNLVLKKLVHELNEYGVTPIQVNVGDKIDSASHNVVEMIKKTGTEDYTIVEEIRKGYMWKNELLRAANVKIVKN